MIINVKKACEEVASRLCEFWPLIHSKINLVEKSTVPVSKPGECCGITE